MPMTILMTVARGVDPANCPKLGMAVVGRIMPCPQDAHILIPGT